jgi:2,4-dienoyl-CoA reductase (NADPH2)
MDTNAIFDKVSIGNLEFKNRILRSSVGGRTANWDGKATEIWKNFEKRFASGGIGGIISTTLNVDETRKSPLQYPCLAHDKYIPRLKKYIAEIKQEDCRYIVQLGDPGYACQTSLFEQDLDNVSSSSGFDMVYGYGNLRKKIEDVPQPDDGNDPVEAMIDRFVKAAARVKEVGADGLEITAAKGYVIHQFLSPALNRREDQWGGDVERRFALLREIVKRVRKEIGPDFPFGLRISADDFIKSPLLFWLARVPWRSESNDVEQMLRYMRTIAADVDFLHVISGFGFPSPHVTAGKFPTEEINIFFNHSSHLSAKAGLRSFMFNLLSRPWVIKQLSNWLIFQRGWEYKEANNLDFAARFKQDAALNAANPNLVVISNGGFQDHGTVNAAISSEKCDMVSMARALIANPNLLTDYWAKDRDPVGKERCTHCNRCVGRTPTSPLGCYDITRFKGATPNESLAAMVAQIEQWNSQDPLPGE